MFTHYAKMVVRSLWKNKAFSAINIIGLAIGMACSLLIFLFVKDEKSYDQFHKDAKNIHRVVKDFINDDGSHIPDATTPAALAPALQRNLPEVVHVTRIYPNWGGSWVMKYGDKKITEENFWRADSSFFDVFSFPLIEGDPKTALNDVHSVVITESIARRYFGSEDAMGKTIQADPGGPLMVTGILRDIPDNSHFHFDFLGSFRQLEGNLDANWGGYNYYTYVKVKDGTDMFSLTKKIQSIYERSQKEHYSVFYTQPLTSIHLNSHLKWELEPNGDKLYVSIFTIIGIFILLIAAINYINLSTAKASVRAKEIGVRKVAGALRSSLIRQFLFESLIISIFAAFLAIIIAQLLITTVNGITDKHLSVTGTHDILFYVFIEALAVGVIAGIFPALYLSSFRPVIVLKGIKMNEKGVLNLRKGLVVMQFTISSVLIIGAIVIIRQIKFIQSTKLGLDKDQVLVIQAAGYLTASDRNAYLNAARELPGVKKATTASIILGGGFSTSRVKAKGSSKEQQINFANVGYNYLDVVGIQLNEGHEFSSRNASDTMNNGTPGGPLEQKIGGILINETAAKELDLGNKAVGKEILWGTDKDTSYYVKVIGVMKDFHFTSLRNEIKPFGFICVPSRQGNFTIKLSGNTIQNTIALLKNQWDQLNSERGFEYIFLDEKFSKMYEAERRFQKVFISLVFLGILIACLGLLGLATYAARQRTKEIGIRKALGASVGNIVNLLVTDFLKLVLIALTISIPISWYYMNKWLENFAYRINIQWWIFLLGGVVAIAIAFFTISFQTFMAARTKPVESLRME